jgi:predicted transcriptional regulator
MAEGRTRSYVLPALERAIDHHGKTLYIAPYRALIIFFEEDGQRKRPVVWFDELVITLPFGPEPSDTATATS